MVIVLTLFAAVGQSLPSDAASRWQVLPTEPASMAVRVLPAQTQEGVAPEALTLAVRQAGEQTVRGEAIVLGEEAPEAWAKGTRLVGCISPYAPITLHDCLLPGSLVVRSGPGEGGTVYERDKDYLLDEKWATLGRAAGGAIPAGATVYADYVCGSERIDTVALLPDGQVLLVEGTPEKVCPKPPALPDNAAPLANIYVPYHAKATTAELIYPIRTDEVVSPGQSIEQKTAAVKRSSAKLHNGGAVKIVFLGDSVTVGGDATKPELRFVDRFGIELGRRFPTARVEVVNAGVGGTNSDFGLERLDKDVLAHDPDLVCIEFVNDMFWPPQKIHENYAALIERIRGHNDAEVIIITPHLMMPEWMGKFEPAVEALRQIAAEKQVGLADASLGWQNLRLMGIPYQTLLANGINHPDDRGHKIFVDALLTFFPERSRG